MPGQLKRYEFVTLAVYLAGGDTREVDTEDVAIRVNELAPGRFTWRKYKSQINIEIVRALLSDAKKEKCGALLSGTGTTGWLLTEAGLEFAAKHADRVKGVPDPVERGREEKRRRKREQARVEASEAFRKHAAGEKDQVTVRDVETLFRLNEYIVGDARKNKVRRMVNALRDDDKVGIAVRFFAELALKERAR